MQSRKDCFFFFLKKNELASVRGSLVSSVTRAPLTLQLFEFPCDFRDVEGAQGGNDLWKPRQVPLAFLVFLEQLEKSRKTLLPIMGPYDEHLQQNLTKNIEVYSVPFFW